MRVRRRVSTSCKAQEGGAFRGRTTLARIEPHLLFASEVLSKNAGEHVQLIPDGRLDRHVTHLAVRLELGKDALLQTAVQK